MRAPERVAVPIPGAERLRLRDHLPGLAVVALAAAVVGGFFLGLYLTGHFAEPLGYDTARYLDQTTIVGTHGLAGVPAVLPPPAKTLASRAGTPVLLLSLAGLFGTTTFAVAAVLPAIAATAAALAAGAFVSWGLRRPAWEAAIVTVTVGVSPELVRLFAPETYTDNLLAAAILLAALVPVLAVARDGRGAAGAVLLLAAAGIAHQDFFAVGVAVLAVTALAFAPDSWRAWRRGERGPLATPTGRMGAVLAGALALVAVVFAALLRAAPATPLLTRAQLRRKLLADLPLYLYPLMLPLGVLGGATLAAKGRGTPGPEDGRAFARRFMLALAGAWFLATLAGVGAFLAGTLSPAHRFLAFFLPLPIAIGIGVAAGARWTAGRGRRAIAGILATLVLGGFAAIGVRDLYGTIAGSRGVEWLLAPRVGGAVAANAYLDAARIGSGAPVVFVVDDRSAGLVDYIPQMAYQLRSGLSADRIPHAHLYVGTPANFLAGRPTLIGNPVYDRAVLPYWRAVRPLLPHRPVALLLRAYNPAYAAVARAHPGWVVAPGVAVLQGPRPTRPFPVPATPGAPRGPGALLALAAGVAGVLVLAGLGWALALLPSGIRPFELLALAPALGIAAVLLVGVLVDAAGIRLAGAGGVLAVALAALAGWAGAAGRRRRRAPARA